MRTINISILNKDSNPATPKKIYPDIITEQPVGSLTELAKLISNPSPTFAWSPAIFSNNYRNQGNYLRTELLVIDYDSKGTIEQAIKAFKDAGLQFIIGTTLNHQKAKAGKPPVDRYRVIVPTDKPITNAALHQYNLEQLTLFTLPFFDTNALVDSSRAYLACVNIVHIEENGLPWTVQDEQLYGALASKDFIDAFVINNPSEGDGFNAALFKAAKRMQSAGYDEEQTIEFMERFIFNIEFSDNGWDHLDKSDRMTIRSAFRGDAGTPRVTQAEFVARRRGEAVPGQDEDELRLKIIREEIPKYLAKISTLTNDLFFEITDLDNRIVQRVDNKNYLLENVVRKRVLSKPEYSLIPNSISSATRIFKDWNDTAMPIENEPEAFTQIEDKSVWAYEKIAISMEDGETPAWDAFLKRCSAPDDFLAWVWSCFELRHKGRQALWLYGHNGQDGKSTVLRVISRIFKNAAVGISDQNLSTNFGLSVLYGKRLAIYSDCLNTRFLMSEKIRTLTAGDVTTIEFKGQTPFSAEMYVRIAVASNLPPEINKTRAETSRLLLIEVEATQDNTANWESQLTAEIPRLLKKAREAYKERCPEHYNIKPSVITEQLVTGAADVGSEQFEEIFRKHFVADKDGFIRAGDLTSVFKEENMSSPEQKRFREFIKNILTEDLGVEGVFQKQRDKQGNIYKGLRLKHSMKSNTLTNKGLTQ